MVNDYSGLGDTGEMLIAYKSDLGNAVFINDRRVSYEVGADSNVSMTSVDDPIVQALLKNEGVFNGFIDYRGENVMAVTKYLKSADWGLVAKKDFRELETPVDDFQKVLFILFGIVAFFTLLVSVVMTKSVAKPLIDLSIITEKIAKGNLSVSLPKELLSLKDESGALSRAFAKMLHSLSDARKNLEKKVSARTNDYKNATKELKLSLKNLEKL